jgi:hypothetical protein
MSGWDPMSGKPNTEKLTELASDLAFVLDALHGMVGRRVRVTLGCEPTGVHERVWAQGVLRFVHDREQIEHSIELLDDGPDPSPRFVLEAPNGERTGGFVIAADALSRVEGWSGYLEVEMASLWMTVSTLPYDT